MQLNIFVNSIGYDGNSAIVDKTAFTKNKGKTVTELLNEGKFRAAAACAVHSNNQSALQEVADRYNELSGAVYKKEQMYKLFGISRTEVKKTLFL